MRFTELTTRAPSSHKPSQAWGWGVAWKQTDQWSPRLEAMWVLGALLSCWMFQPNTLLKYSSPSGPAQIRIFSEHHGIAGGRGAELAMLPPWQVCAHYVYGLPLMPGSSSSQLHRRTIFSWSKGRTGIVVGQSRESRPLETPWGILSRDADKHGWVGCGSFHLGSHCSAERQISDKTFLCIRCS